MASRQNRCFVVTPPGFEKICRQELQTLGIDNPLAQVGGVEFIGGLQELYLANLWLRSASRVLVRVGELQARDFPALYKRLLRLPWGRFVKPGSDCTIRVSCRRSRLSHSGRIAETCQAAIAKALGPPEAGHPKSTIYLRIEADCCQVSVDSTGAHLHRRGYRLANVAAPLRENLAAGCLLALGYDGSEPLLDAMTGAGTFAIEAAMIAMRRAPGRDRSFAFMDWPKYRPGLWQQLVRDAQRGEKSAPPKPIIGVDNNPKAIAAAEQNLTAFGLSGAIELNCQLMQELAAGLEPGLLICNPPYGERLGRNATLEALYKDLGRVYGETFATWRGALVCPDQNLIRLTGIGFAPRLRFSNGGIRVALLEKSEPTKKP